MRLISRKETIWINSIRDLEKYGINVLTGEACSFGMRWLCDLNEDGVDLLQSFYGVTLSSENWNSQVNGKPAIASFMLSRGTYVDLVVFLLFRLGCDVVIKTNDTFVGCNRIDNLDFFESYKEYADEIFYHPQFSNPSVDGRNVHGFTGRVV